MKEKDLKRLGRKELLEIIYEMKKRELALRAELDAANEQLADRSLKLANTGSIAEAALAVNGVFEAAQAAAEDYLRAARAEADRIVAEAKGK